MYSQRVAKTNQMDQQKNAPIQRRSQKPNKTPLNPIQKLHQTIGNRAVGRMIQARSTTGVSDFTRTQVSNQVQRQDDDELDYPGPRSWRQGEEEEQVPPGEEVVPGARIKPLREDVAQERRGSERSFSPAQRALPHSSATKNIGDAQNLDGQGLYGWDRAIIYSDVEQVVNGVVPTATSPEQMPGIIIYSGTHGFNPSGHLWNDALSRLFVGQDQAIANAANADPQVQVQVVDVVTQTKDQLTSVYNMTDYIRILGWCFSKRSYNHGGNLKSNWWPAPNNI